MAGEWDDLASGYRNAFTKLLWGHTGLDPTAKRVVLDFGCGSGLLTEALRRQSPESDFICIDAAPSMIRVVEEKIQSSEWKNVRAHCVALAELEKAGEVVQNDLEDLVGKVDLIVASSVMSFVPKSDLGRTMTVLGSLLKPENGIFVHSDWPQNDDNPDGLTTETAMEMYSMGFLHKKSELMAKIDMGGHEGDIFLGVAGFN